MSDVERNWAGNYTFRGRVHRPRTLEELQEVLARSPKVRALGSRHSFNDLADSVGGDLVDLSGLTRPVDVDRVRGTVTASGSTTYGALGLELQRQGLGLHATASLPHISVAGAIATATHGSGIGCGNLATAVSGLELVRADGEVVRLARGDADFDGAVVGLGALGVVTAVTLDTVPTYDVRQDVYEGLSWDELDAHFDEITAAAYSVSLFTGWGAQVDQVWLKSRVPAGEAGSAPAEVFGARPATRKRHPLPEMDPQNSTEQLGVPGPWIDRLPHFKLEFTPSNGDEVQAEYLLPRAHAVEAVRALREVAPAFAPLLIVAEIRTVAADDLWLSTAYGHDTVALHFTFRKEEAAVLDALVPMEEVLLPLGARPHWGKLFRADRTQLEGLYERLPDFRDLAKRYDPDGVFRNGFLDRYVL